MSEKMREEFEGWVKSFIGESWLTKDKLRDGEYSDDGTQFMWDAWQASRASLVVELPDEYMDRYLDKYQEGFNDAVESCRNRLEDLGVELE